MRVNPAIHHPAAQNADSAKKAVKSEQAEAQRSERAREAQATQVPGSVNAEISSRGRELAHAKQVASAAPDVREDRIAELKRKISEGKYNVSADAVADKLVNEHLSTSGMS